MSESNTSTSTSASTSTLFKALGASALFVGAVALYRRLSGTVVRNNTALIIVDVQNDFCPPNGSLAVAEGDQVIPIINELKKMDMFGMVVLTQDWHPANHMSFLVNNKDRPDAKLFQPLDLGNGKSQVMWPAHCIQESKGAEFHPLLNVEPTDVVIKKGTRVNVDSYSGFFDNDHNSQHNITEVFVCGLAYDYCVGFTALDAQQQNFRTTLIADACRGVAKESTEEMIQKLKQNNVNIINSTDL